MSKSPTVTPPWIMRTEKAHNECAASLNIVKAICSLHQAKATEFCYEGEAQPLPKMRPWTDQLNELLLANEGKSPRERLTLIRLFEELRGRGYNGGYALCHTVEQGARALDGRGLCPADLPAG
jgi:hypothetical protein